MKTYFYTFHQQDFDVRKDNDDWREYVIVEAESAKQANGLVLTYGITFDKWNVVVEEDRTNEPIAKGINPMTFDDEHNYLKFYCDIYMLNGKYARFCDRRLCGEL